MDLRAEGTGEEAAVRDVVTQAFGGERVGELLDALRSSDAWLGLSFVAERAGEVVAHLSLTASGLDAPRELVRVLVLSPVSVVPELQRRGIGSALVTYAIEQLGSRPEPRRRPRSPSRPADRPRRWPPRPHPHRLLGPVDLRPGQEHW